MRVDEGIFPPQGSASPAEKAEPCGGKMENGGLPLVLASSTSSTSFSIDGGERLTTLNTVRSTGLQASLWNIMTTLVVKW